VVEVTDLTQLGQLVAELPAAGASELHGPVWEVDQTNPAHVQARRAAALDAQQRAAAYADALGHRLGRLKWLAELGLRPDAPGPGAVGAAARFLDAAATTEESMDISPDEITIHAMIDGSFELVDERDVSGRE